MLTGGRFPKRVAGMQPVELHHTDQQSGRRRSTLLTAPILEPERGLSKADNETGGETRWRLAELVETTPH